MAIRQATGLAQAGDGELLAKRNIWASAAVIPSRLVPQCPVVAYSDLRHYELGDTGLGIPGSLTSGCSGAERGLKTGEQGGEGIYVN